MTTIGIWASRPNAPTPTRHYCAPCHEQPGKQAWHLECALRHPVRFLRSRGPRRWRHPGLARERLETVRQIIQPGVGPDGDSAEALAIWAMDRIAALTARINEDA